MRDRNSNGKPPMRINANQHIAHNRARLAGAGVCGAGWLALSAADLSDTVKFSITMTPKRAAGGLSQGGIPFS
jgi:hypothetical protein